jgi:hypothetical protein
MPSCPTIVTIILIDSHPQIHYLHLSKRNPFKGFKPLKGSRWNLLENEN